MDGVRDVSSVEETNGDDKDEAGSEAEGVVDVTIELAELEVVT